MAFLKAVKYKSKLRMAISGPSGGGKSLTALRFAFALGKKVAVISTEPGAIEKYLGESPDGIPFEFDVSELKEFSPESYTKEILIAGREKYDVLIIDSLTHAWEGVNGALEQVENQPGNSFTAWKTVTPKHRRMVEAILRSPCHVIVTMRSKMEYVLEKNSHGKMVPKPLGMAPIQRKGMEYEFDIFAHICTDHILTVQGTRCSAVDGLSAVKPGAEIMKEVKTWLEDGIDPPEGYYTVSAEEIERLTKKAEAEERKNRPAKKVLSAEEIMRQAANKTEEKEASPKGEYGGLDFNEVMREEAKQKEKIIARIKKNAPIAFGGEWVKIIKGALAKRNAGKLIELTKPSLMEMLEKILAKALMQNNKKEGGPAKN